MIKLIISDVDGTLLRNGLQRLNPSLFPLLTALKEKGIRFAAASGRQLHSLQQLFSPIQDEIYYIAENGSLCVHDGEILAKGEIPRDLGLELFEYAKNARFHCLLSCEACAYTDSQSAEFLHLMRHEIRSNIHTVEDLAQIKESFLKISFYNFDHSRTPLLRAYDAFSSRLKVATSGPGWIDFTAIGINKGAALTRLTEYLSIRSEECLAFGDEYNDKEMLQFAGSSYAIEGGAAGIEKYAKSTTDSVEKVLRELLDSLS